MSAIPWTSEAADLRALLDALSPSSTHRVVGEGVHARLAALGSRYDFERAALGGTMVADEDLFADEFTSWIGPALTAWEALDLAARYVEDLAVAARARTPSRFLARSAEGVDVILAPEVALDPPDLPEGPTFDECLARSAELDQAPSPAGRDLLSLATDPVLSLRARTPGVSGRRIEVRVVSVVAGRATITAALGRYVETFEAVVTGGERAFLGSGWDASRLLAPPVHLAPAELVATAALNLTGGAGAWVEALRDRAQLAMELPEAVGPARQLLALERQRFEAQWALRPVWRSRLEAEEQALHGALAESVAMRALLGWSP